MNLKHIGPKKLKEEWEKKLAKKALNDKSNFVLKDSREETKKALEDLSNTEALQKDKVEDIINDYLFTGRMATEDEVIETLQKQPSVLQRESISIRVKTKIMDFISTFINGVDS